MTLTTTQSREGFGYADAKSYGSKPEMKAPGVYSPKEHEPFSRDIIKKIAQLEKILKEGGATAEEVEHLESLKYMMNKGPFGC